MATPPPCSAGTYDKVFMTAPGMYSSRPVVLQAENIITEAKGWTVLIAVLDHRREEAGGVIAGARCDEGRLRHEAVAPVGAERALVAALHKVDGVCSVAAIKVNFYSVVK